jgi:hypothetical protein
MSAVEQLTIKVSPDKLEKIQQQGCIRFSWDRLLRIAPDEALLRNSRERAQQIREHRGRWGSLKKLELCSSCQQMLSARQRRVHKCSGRQVRRKKVA